MDALNYHHLSYFWSVAKEGSVRAAAERLGLAQPTISGQIRALEKQLGARLFEKSGRGLVLTDFGRQVLPYAERIFDTGRELMDRVRSGLPDRALDFRVGVSWSLPKLLTHAILAPALSIDGQALRLLVREGRPDRMVPELALQDLDLILSETPSPRLGFRAQSHLLGSCPVGFFATTDLRRRHARDFPGSLDGAPFLLPAPDTQLRLELDLWLSKQGIEVDPVGEFEDFALLKIFGESGQGIFPAALPLQERLRQRSGVRLLGEAKGLRQAFYALSLERRARHPAVQALRAIPEGSIFENLSTKPPRRGAPSGR